MSRESQNEIVDGIVKNGFDYDFQAWIEDFKIVLAGSSERTAELKGLDIRDLIRPGTPKA